MLIPGKKLKCKNCGMESIALINGFCSYECEVQWRNKFKEGDEDED